MSSSEPSGIDTSSVWQDPGIQGTYKGVEWAYWYHQTGVVVFEIAGWGRSQRANEALAMHAIQRRIDDDIAARAQINA